MKSDFLHCSGADYREYFKLRETIYLSSASKVKELLAGFFSKTKTRCSPMIYFIAMAQFKVQAMLAEG